jgi:hypothetical protein
MQSPRNELRQVIKAVSLFTISLFGCSFYALNDSQRQRSRQHDRTKRMELAERRKREEVREITEKMTKEERERFWAMEIKTKNEGVKGL